MNSTNKDQYLLQSLDNALSVLRLFEQEDSLNLSQVAQRCNLNKTVAYRILYTLEKRGFLYLCEDGRYTLGIRIVTLGSKIQMHDTISRLVKPALQKLSADLRETVHIVRRLDARQVILIDEVLPRQGLVATSIQRHAPRFMHLCSTGVALLSTESEEKIRKYASSVAFEKKTPYSISTAEELFEKLCLVQQKGYAINNQYYENGVCSIAVPIRTDPQKAAEFAISISGPAERILCQTDNIVQHLWDTSRELSRLLD